MDGSFAESPAPVFEESAPRLLKQVQDMGERLQASEVENCRLHTQLNAVRVQDGRVLAACAYNIHVPAAAWHHVGHSKGQRYTFSGPTQTLIWLPSPNKGDQDPQQLLLMLI